MEKQKTTSQKFLYFLYRKSFALIAISPLLMAFKMLKRFFAIQTTIHRFAGSGAKTAYQFRMNGMAFRAGYLVFFK